MTASVRKSAPDQALLTPPQTPWQRERVCGAIVPLVPVPTRRRKADAFVAGVAIAAAMLIVWMIGRYIFAFVIWAVSK